MELFFAEGTDFRRCSRLNIINERSNRTNILNSNFLRVAALVNYLLYISISILMPRMNKI